MWKYWLEVLMETGIEIVFVVCILNVEFKLALEISGNVVLEVYHNLLSVSVSESVFRMQKNLISEIV